MAKAVSRRPYTAEARVSFQMGSRGIFIGKRGTGTGFSLSTSVSPVSIIPPMLHTHSFIYHRRCRMFFSQYFSFPCQYHSANAPYSFIHLPPTLYNVFLPVLQLYPVSIIPPMLHTHSFIYHGRCIMFFSQYLSFPCQYHSTNIPYSFIHLPPTLYNVFLPVLQFSPVSIIPPMPHTHSFIYHGRCIMFFSQYFSFPCQYHSTNAPYSFIHLPLTGDNLNN
jgi:hypothetical protein